MFGLFCYLDFNLRVCIREVAANSYVLLIYLLYMTDT